MGQTVQQRDQFARQAAAESGIVVDFGAFCSMASDGCHGGLL